MDLNTNYRTVGPCFVVGNSRSGTTMLGRILGAHSSVFTFKELHFFENLCGDDDFGISIDRQSAVDLAAKLLTIQRDGYLNQKDPAIYREEASVVLSGLNEYTFEGVYNQFLAYETRMRGKLISCDQTPRNALYVKEILDLFPNARVINMIRDPRDVLLSQKQKWKRKFLGAKKIPLSESFRSWVNYHPVVICKLWNASIRMVDKVSHDSRVLNLKFEDLLNSPEPKVIELCNFVGIDYQPEMLDVPQVGSSTGMDDKDKKGINSVNLDKWKTGGLSNTEVYLCEKYSGHDMIKNGYVSSGTKGSLVVNALFMISLPLKLSSSLLLNLKRMRNISKSIKRRLT